ncbi:MAG TPA: 50S ribosomal protein L23 [bacterium]|uniref:Large ribosomal subunit protein uL23 n=1 Tax=uncultured bacterium Rifle_16ft_4_minimus_4564 TaxID=1665161 RepID=A0A0H4T8N2_9BACT|nr:50S ribosomal protein L23, large subunit ribosomal protein L23 [uncultured bacterium Rifle_16ft_4_minimus_4564]
MNLQEVIKRSVITEKSAALKAVHNILVLEVDIRANKTIIKETLRKAFNVTPLDIRTSIVRGKTRSYGRFSGKRKNWKKAIVTLKDGDHIEAFEVK